MQLPVKGVPNSDNFKLGILAEAARWSSDSKRETEQMGSQRSLRCLDVLCQRHGVDLLCLS